MRPIVSSIGTYSYELSKYLVDLLKPLTTNDYTIKDSFSFVNELNSVRNVPFMSSFDVTSLFTNIPLEETIEICLNKLYSDNDKSTILLGNSSVNYSILHVEKIILCSMVKCMIKLMVWQWVLL